MDRCFVLIENSRFGSSGHPDRDGERTNTEEKHLEMSLYMVFYNIFVQCSPPIYKAALDKLQSYVSTHIFEIKMSGKYVGSICRAATKANPELALHTFLPHRAKLILALTENDEVLKEEKLDNEFLFSLQLLSEVVLYGGNALIGYHELITKVLHRTLHLKCREGYSLACCILRNTLRAYTHTYPLEQGNTLQPWTLYQPEEYYKYIELWGKPGDIHHLGLEYHTTSDEELSAARSLLETFLLPELHTLSSSQQSREEVHCSLCIVHDCLQGPAFCLPPLPGEQLQLQDSCLPPTVRLECGAKQLDVQEGSNVRQLIADTMHSLLEHFSEDDTKSLNLIIKIYHYLLFYWGKVKEEVDARWQIFRTAKKIRQNQLKGKKSNSRTLMIERTVLQHKLRTVERNRSRFTAMHVVLMKDLLKLSVSHYSEIRILAQSALQMCFATFRSCYRLVLDDILELLKKDPTTSHEEFKGVLYVLIGQRNCSMLTVHNWEVLSKLWPQLVASKHSEKPSITRLLEYIPRSTLKYLHTFQIRIQVPPSCLQAAKRLGCLPETPEAASDQENEQHYLSLVHRLSDLLKNGNLHWRHYHLGLQMLQRLLRYDIRFPKEGVHLFVSHLTHDMLLVRKFAIMGTVAILQQQKREHPKVEMARGEQKVGPLHPLLKGRKVPESAWLQYNSLDPPTSLQKWEDRHFLHKSYHGFYAWPKTLKCYAPDAEQPKLDRTYEELTEEEKPIFDAFSKESFVDSLITYLSLEERKEHDHVDQRRIYLFRNLFRNFGDTFLPLFLEHLKRMCCDKQESVQRCAIEIISGLLMGCKHWDFVKMHSLKEKLSPILRLLMTHILSETLADWCASISMFTQSRDPNKYYWIFELFLEEPVKEETGAFAESSWLFMLLCASCHQEWRIFEILHRTLAYLEPRLCHSYKKVRDKMGSLLSNIFMYDLPVEIDSLSWVPRRGPFIESLLPKLANLTSGADPLLNHTEESTEYKNARNLLKTICRWLISHSKNIYAAPPEVFKLLPLLCLMEHDTKDDGLNTECCDTIVGLGQAMLNEQSIQVAIDTLKNIVASDSWHSRETAMSFLQIMVFSNLFTVIKNDQWIQDMTSMVLILLQDVRVEVRESAAETLGGFLHCGFIELTDELLETFKAKCSRRAKMSDPEELRERHAGILGLCACVDAFPYDVPEFLPDILVLLADHLYQPQPIETTIKKTMSSFRRTHHDNWRDHKLKFTDDQLAVITDLLVSPSYYA